MPDEIKPSRYGDDFEQRKERQQNFIVQAAQDGEGRYTHVGGEYHASVKTYLINEIVTLLEKKKDRPVVLIDVGGGLGQTWGELAMLFSQEVKSGRLVFIVSNLRQTPESIAEDTIKSYTELISEKPTDFPFLQTLYKRNISKLIEQLDQLKSRRKQVHYVTASFSELHTQQVRLDDGSIISLENNADIVHEAFSVSSWDLIPEETLIQMENLLSIHGKYMVPERDTQLHQNAAPFSQETFRDSIAIAHEDLEKNFGMIRELHQNVVNRDDGGSPYLVFRRL